MNITRRSLPLALLSLLCTLIAHSQTSILGFTPTSAAHQTAIETKFKSIPSPDEERRQHRIFTSEPHVAGSKRNNELADYIAGEWRKQGLEDVIIRRYDVYGTNPKAASLEMLAPVHYQATLREAALDADPDSKNPAISGAWSGMSISGEVTAPVVYAHSGNPEDYDLLRKNGISVKGKLVLVRYSNPYSYRGFKALTAQREGAAAILIYSDPAEDGYKKGKVDPGGPWGPEYHIQRGAITYDFIVPGDPLTPGWASVPGAKRIPIEQAESAPKIMALPLSWHDAKPLLENMDGPLAPTDWQGGLPIQYHLGGDAVKVHLKIEMENGTQPYYVVEGRIRGAELPDDALCQIRRRRRRIRTLVFEVHRLPFELAHLMEWLHLDPLDILHRRDEACDALDIVRIVGPSRHQREAYPYGLADGRQALGEFQCRRQIPARDLAIGIRVRAFDIEQDEIKNGEIPVVGAGAEEA